MKTLPKVAGARIIIALLTTSIAAMPASAAEPKLIQAYEGGAGGQTVTTLPGGCADQPSLVCPDGDECVCYCFTADLATLKPSEPRPDKPDHPLNEDILEDMSRPAPNGAGGSCWPFDGLGILSDKAGGADAVTLTQQRSVCQIEGSASLAVQGTFELRNGQGDLAGSTGEGTLDFTLGPNPSRPATSSHPQIPVVIAVVGVVILIADAVAFACNLLCK